MSLFSKNLRWLRIYRDINQHFIGDLVKRKANTISNWENDVAEPSISDLLIISKFFGISVDVLLVSDLAKTVAGKESDTYRKAGVLPETIARESDPAQEYKGENELEQRLASIDRRLEAIAGKLDGLT